MIVKPLLVTLVFLWVVQQFIVLLLSRFGGRRNRKHIVGRHGDRRRVAHWCRRLAHMHSVDVAASLILHFAFKAKVAVLVVHFLTTEQHFLVFFGQMFSVIKKSLAVRVIVTKAERQAIITECNYSREIKRRCRKLILPVWSGTSVQRARERERSPVGRPIDTNTKLWQKTWSTLQHTVKLSVIRDV